MALDLHGIEEAKPLLPDSVQYVDDLYAALLDADAVVLMTEWNVYRGMNLGRARRAMHGDVFVDLRNVYEPDMMREHGFQYIGVGR